jgi:hypothetical protein
MQFNVLLDILNIYCLTGLVPTLKNRSRRSRSQDKPQVVHKIIAAAMVAHHDAFEQV